MTAQIRIQLSLMMFFQFFIWGAWYVTFGNYLGTIGLADFIGKAYSTIPIGAIFAPLIVGMIADRFFPAQKVLATLHIVGAGFIYLASTLTDPGTLFWTLVAYALTYMPTLALVNAIAFHQMENPAKQFPAIRVLGTLGWIAAGLIVSLANLEAEATPLRIAAAVSLFLGLYAFTLPNTPPKAAGKKVSLSDVLGLDALRLLKERSFATFVFSSFLIATLLPFYYNYANLFLNTQNFENAAGKMTLGQVSEIFFMILIPFFFARLGVKKMLLIGIIAWAIRYVLFAFGNTQALVFMFYTGILLHGICYDFFFVAGQIYVDSKAPQALRASAQGLISLVTYGFGMFFGSHIAGYVFNRYQVLDDAGAVAGQNWQATWLVPAMMAAVVFVVFAALFKEDKSKERPQADHQSS